MTRTVSRLALAAALVTTGCRSSQEVVDGPARTTVTLQVSGDKEDSAVFDTLAAAFESENVDVDVDVVKVADPDDHLAKLATSAASGSLPSAFVLTYREAGRFVETGATRPVGPVLAEQKASVDGWAPTALAGVSSGGVLQCLPLNASSLVVYANTELLANIGAKVPVAGWTWDDLAALARALTGGGVHGLGVAPRLIRFGPAIWSAGGQLVDDVAAPTTTRLSTPEGQRALSLVSTLVADGVVPDMVEQRASRLETRFAEGRLALYLGSRKDTPRFREAGMAFDVAPLPTVAGGSPASILHSDGLCLGKKTGAAARATDRFVAFLTGPEAQVIAAASGRLVPVSSAGHAAFVDVAQHPRSAQVWLDQLPVLQRVPATGRWAEAEDAADKELERLFTRPPAAAADVAAAIDERSRALLRGP